MNKNENYTLLTERSLSYHAAIQACESISSLIDLLTDLHRDRSCDSAPRAANSALGALG